MPHLIPSIKDHYGNVVLIGDAVRPLDHYTYTMKVVGIEKEGLLVNRNTVTFYWTKPFRKVLF